MIWKKHIDDLAKALGVPPDAKSMALVKRWDAEIPTVAYTTSDGDTCAVAADDEIVEQLLVHFGVTDAYEMALTYDWQSPECVPVLVVKSDASSDKPYLGGKESDE